MSNSDYMFLFGAGVEYVYGLPTGSDYTQKSLFPKNDDYTEALRSFYKNRINDEYSGSYRKDRIIYKYGRAFKDIVERAARVVSETNSDISEIGTKAIIERLWEEDDYKKDKTIRNTFDDYIDSNYDAIIDNTGNSYSLIQENYVYDGAIEKDFSSLINPKRIGKIRFWRLINYFWSAYFSILIPLIQKSKYAESFNNNDYNYLLNNLYEIINHIYEESFINGYASDSEKDYYLKIKEKMDSKYAATLNYTPFINRLGLSRDNLAFLAGELSTFEKPDKLEVFSLTKKNYDEKDFIIPFLMTQASVKPIVSRYQIDEYNKMISFMDNVDTIITVGYSLGDADNHVNSLLHDYVKGGKKLIYCSYCGKEKSFDHKEEINHVMQSIKIDNDKDIIVIRNTGDVDQLIDDIKKNL